MTIKSGFVMQEVAGQYVVVATNPAISGFQGMIRLNRTGAAIWRALERGADDESDIARQLAEQFEVSERQALTDVHEFVDLARERGFLS